MSCEPPVMAGPESRIFRLLSYAISDGTRTETQGMSNETMLSDVHNTCYELMVRDYSCEMLENSTGQLCSTYPSKMIIPCLPKHKKQQNRLFELVHRSRFARTRSRFVVPVMLVNGKYVCRSSTLARSPEIYCRCGYGYWMQGESLDVEVNETSLPEPEMNPDSDLQEYEHEKSYSNGIVETADTNTCDNDASGANDRKSKEWLLDKMRNADISLMNFLRVDTIFDLMVEKKKVKFGMNVTSSEKVDRQQRYSEFNLLSVPYPGCEFFTEYCNCNYMGEGLMFDWKQTFVNADIHVPDNIRYLPDVNWQEYMNWDLIRLTQNYLKLALHSLMDKDSTGILLHCISGWDRTPLFVSLVRLSLWADGIAHKSLSPEEIVYFTVAYDWLLFSHQFGDRITKGEEIFYFCFDFLKYIESEEFSMKPRISPDGSREQVPIANSKSNLHNSTVSTNAGEYAEMHLTEETNTELNGVHDANGLKDAAVGEKTNGFVKFYPKQGEVAVIDINDCTDWANEQSPEEIIKTNSVNTFDNHSESSTVLNGASISANVQFGSIDGNIENFPDVLNGSFDIGVIGKQSNRCVNKPNTAETANFQDILDVQDSVGGGKNGDESVDMQQGQCNSDLKSNLTKRRKNLKLAREFLIPAYQAAVQQYRDIEQQQNSGLAATIFNQISRTLNFKR